MNEKIVLTDGDIDTLSVLVKPYLTEKRYAHTVSVKNEAVKLGEIYLPEDKNRLAASALLHDITKKADIKKQLQYCVEFGIIIGNNELLSPSVFHAMTGAALASRDFPSYTDSEIISGVRWHTTGRDGMSVFESLIFLADYIEETRNFDDCVRVRQYFYDKLSSGADKYSVLTDTMIFAFDLTIKGLIKDGSIIDPNTIGARNYYIAERHRDENKPHND